MLDFPRSGHKCVVLYYHVSTLQPVELTDEFPREQPNLVLRSIYHRLEGYPCQSVVMDYPYSPRWNAEEKAERIRYEHTIIYSAYISWVYYFSQIAGFLEIILRTCGCLLFVLSVC